MQDAEVKSKPPFYGPKEIGQLILLIVLSLSLLILLVGYILTSNAILLVTDGLIGTALATILAYYFKP